MKLKIIAQISAIDKITYYRLKAGEEHSAILAKGDALYCAAFYKNSEYKTTFQQYFLDMIERNKCDNDIDLDLTEIKINPYLKNRFKSLTKLVEMYSKADEAEKYNEVLHSVDDYIYYGKIKEIIQKRKNQLDIFLQQNAYLKINNILKDVRPEKRELAIKIYKKILMNTLTGTYNLKYYQKITNAYINFISSKEPNIQTDNDFLGHLLDDKKIEMPDVSKHTALGDINQTYDNYFLFEENRER